MNQTNELKLLYLGQNILEIVVVPIMIAFGICLLLVTKYQMKLTYQGLLVLLLYLVFVYAVGVLFYVYSLMLKEAKRVYQKHYDHELIDGLAQKFLNLEARVDKFWYVLSIGSFIIMLVVMVFGIFTNKESLCINYVNACFYLGLYALSTLVALRVYR